MWIQMSDWEQRPLSSRQTEYAALDAFVLLQVYDAITGGQGLTQQQLEPFVYSYTDQKRQQRATAKAAGMPTDDYQPKRQAMQQNASSQSGCRSAKLDSRSDQSSSAQPCSGNNQGITSQSREPALKQDDVSACTDSSACGYLHGPQDQQSLSGSEPGEAVTLLAGSPLQQCLQENKLQGVVKSLAPGAG